jgi:hypothetical protein
MTLALATFQVQPTSTLREPLTLRWTYNQDFLDVNNVPVLGASKNFYIEFDCSIASGVVTVNTEDVFTTLDSNIQTPQSVNCTAQFFVGNSGKDYLFTQWVVPDEASYPGGTITFAQLTIYNTGSNTLANPPQTFLTAAETIAYFSTLNPAPDAATNVKGIGFVSVAPVAAGSPIFLGQNDPAVAGSSTVSTNKSIAGSAATSNSSNISVADSKAVSDSVITSSLTTTTNSKVTSNSLNISVADSKGISAGTRASVADSKAVSDSILTSTADSKGDSAGTRASVADSKAVSDSILASTADSKGVSAGTQASTADSKALSDSVVTSALTTTTNSKIASMSTNLSVTTSTANSG